MNYFLKCYLRMYYLYNGSFDKIKYSKLYSKIKSALKCTNDELQCKLYESIGYVNNQSYSSVERESIRKLFTTHISDKRFLNKKMKEMGFDSLNRFLRNLGEEELIANELVYTDDSLNPYLFKGYLNFLERHKDLVDIYIEGSDYILSNLSVDNNKLTLSEVCTIVGGDVDYDTFRDNCKKLKLDINSIITIKRGKSVKIVDGFMYIPNTVKESDSDIAEYLFYSLCIKANIIDVHLTKHYSDIITTVCNLLLLSDDLFLEFIDLINVSGLSAVEFFKRMNLNLVNPDKMISTTSGIFTIADSEHLHYVPASLEDERAVPCYLSHAEFIKYVNSSEILNIVYKDGIPVLDNRYLFEAE